MAAEQGRSWLRHFLSVKTRTALGRRITPPFVTLYVTTRCDEQCVHCYYWNELNPKPNRDFSLAEFQKTLASMGEIYNLFIGGGEPFLRPDLGEILIAAARINRVANIYVPTNGQHTERALRVVEQTLAAAPDLRLHINLSVDHVDPLRYEAIRGRTGAWRRMRRTADALKELRERQPRLILHTLCTVMKENQAEILAIHEGLKERFEPDGASYNFCRGNPLDPAQSEVDPARYRALVERLEADLQAGELTARGPSRHPAVNQLLDQRIRRSVERTVVERRAQFRCVAGRLAGVIYSDGRVVECETKNTELGNLRDADYDFPRIWNGERSREAARKAADGCFCTHECGHYSSTIYEAKTALALGAKRAAMAWKGR